MEGAGAGAGFRKELVSRLLQLHFKDDKTKGAGGSERGCAAACGGVAEGLRCGSSSPRGAAGPGRRRAPCGRGPAGEAPGLLGISAMAEATPRGAPGPQKQALCFQRPLVTGREGPEGFGVDSNKIPGSLQPVQKGQDCSALPPLECPVGTLVWQGAAPRESLPPLPGAIVCVPPGVLQAGAGKGPASR
ncbi:centromere protein X isoform X2 [Symphalangus syndactylus]|uniref:centromere protein X isoform X2 n=1 Tax=Symphalangus syndactylus TaxID=9590 RepID=UPI0030069982